MYFYSAQFGYLGPKSFAGSIESSNALTKAIQNIDNIMMPESIKMIHSYAWPDGSLYQYLMSVNPLTKEAVNELFVTKLDGVQDGDILYCTIDALSNPYVIQYPSWSTIEERFLIDADERMNIYKTRKAKIEGFYGLYHEHRAFCTECPEIGLACKIGDDMYIVASKLEHDYINIPRPMVKND